LPFYSLYYWFTSSCWSGSRNIFFCLSLQNTLEGICTYRLTRGGRTPFTTFLRLIIICFRFFCRF
jgi:hypothetical protein